MSMTTDYLKMFASRANAAGLDVKRPGSNWIACRDLVPGSHLSLSVRKDQIQVNLNNEGDLERTRFGELFSNRSAISIAVNEPLFWEQKEGRKKTAVRATFHKGIDDRESWDEQHDWALTTMKSFEREFGSRLRQKS